MRIFLAFASLPLVACFGGERADTGECPAGEVCSPRTPNGLHFIGNALVDDVLLSGPAPTAVGGTQEVSLEYDPGPGTLRPLDLAYEADDDGGIGVKVESHTGPVVTVRGMGSRTNYLRILDAGDGTLFDRKQLTGASLDTVKLVTTDFERVPLGASLVWFTGRQGIGVALFGAVQTGSGPEQQRLVDTSMSLQLAGSERVHWDTLRLGNATVGTSPLVVTAGNKAALSVDITIVDHADSIAPIAPVATTIQPNTSREVCFQGLSAGKYIAGMIWTYNVDGNIATKTGTDLTRNCITFTTARTSGNLVVQAMAGGQSASVTLAIGAMARELPQVATPTILGSGRFVSTAGDRASL